MNIDSKKEQNEQCTIPVVSGSFVTIEDCLRLGNNIEGLQFTTKHGQVKTAKKFVFSDAGTPYLYWGEYEAGCLIPAINLRIQKRMRWL